MKNKIHISIIQYQGKKTKRKQSKQQGKSPSDP